MVRKSRHMDDNLQLTGFSVLPSESAAKATPLPDWAGQTQSPRPSSGLAPADASGASFDGEQAQLRMIPGSNGTIFSLRADGALLYYQHQGWKDGSATWANGGNGVQIGSGWQVFHTVLASGDGQLYAF